MITNATVSVIGVLVLLLTAWGYFAVPARKVRGRGLYMLMLAFALMHLIGDGVLRAEIGEPMSIAIGSLNGVGMLYFFVYLTGAIGVLQIAFDIMWVRTRPEIKVGSAIMIQIPAVALLIATIAVRGTFCGVVLKYMPLLYALILFFMTMWFYEKLDRGLRIGTLAAMIGCVLIFVSNSVLHITAIPLMASVVLLVIALSWDGRGEVVLQDISDEEFERLQEKGYVGVEAPEDAASDEDAQPTHTVIVTDRVPMETAMLPELERMMRANEKAGKEKLSLDSELPGTTGDPLAASPVADAPAMEAPVGETAGSDTQAAPAAEAVSGMREVQPALQDADTISIREEDVIAAGMRAVEPTPMEQLTAAAALTAESDSQSEDTLEYLSQVDETVSDVLHNRPLIMEKELNEYYHRMKAAIKEKDYDTCLEIMSEMSEYRISGIHVTRYERIRHAVVDEEWNLVEKELKGF